MNTPHNKLESLAAAELARKERISALNKRLLARGYTSLLLHERAEQVTDEHIAERERLLNQQDAQIAGKSELEFSAENPAAPHGAGLLTKLVQTFSGKQEAARRASEEAYAAVRHAEAVQARYDQLRADLKVAQQRLALGKEVHAKQAEALAAKRATVFADLLRETESVAENCEALSNHHASIAVLTESVKSWPQIEKVLVERVKGLEADIAKIEAEFA